jgi:hypothetical protein
VSKFAALRLNEANPAFFRVNSHAASLQECAAEGTFMPEGRQIS